MSFENILNFQLNFKRFKSLILSKEEISLFNNIPRLNLRALTFYEDDYRINEEEINKMLNEHENLPYVKKIGEIYTGNNNL